MNDGDIDWQIKQAAHCADRFKTIAFAHLDRPIPELLAASVIELKAALTSLTDGDHAERS